MHENDPHNPGMTPETQVQKDFEGLKKMIKVIGEMGFQVIERPTTPDILEDPTSEAGFPLVHDGVDGIRASYTKDRGLVIWFTNTFEDPQNSQRQEVVQRLREEGLM